MKTLCDNYSVIKNGFLGKLSTVFIKRSKQTRRLLEVLYKEGVIRGFNMYSPNDRIEVLLKYLRGYCVINDIQSISSSSRHVFFTWEDICYWDKKSQHSFLILSTSKNVISSHEAKHLGVGGKVLCIIN
jgi:ribosomal protein S8